MTESILAPVAALALPDAAKITNSAQQALSFIETFAIVDGKTYGMAAEELQAIKGRAKRLEEQRTAITGPINTALKAVNDLFRGPAELLARAETLVKQNMIGYDNEQKRQADERRRQAEAAAAAERQRLEAEAAERQREAQAQAEAAAAAQAAGDAQAAELANAAAARAQAEANQAASVAQMVTAPVQTSIAMPKAAGISTRKKIDFEVQSIEQLLRHIVGGGDRPLAHPELLSLLAVQEPKLRAYVTGLGTACKLPGVRVFETDVMSARAK